MAKPAGLIRFKGTIDELSFYESKHGPIVRRKGGPDPKAMKTQAKFKRVRESGKEFGACAKAAGYLRKALLPLVREAADFRVTSRLIKVLYQVKDLDASSARGKRHVDNGLNSAEGRALLKGFEFNSEAALSSVLKKTYSLNITTGTISIAGFKPKPDVNAPKGATHVRLTSAWLKIDFAGGAAQLKQSVAANLPLNNSSTNVTLNPGGPPSGQGHDVFVLQVCFFQEVNGTQHALNDATHNCMAVVEVV